MHNIQSRLGETGRRRSAPLVDTGAITTQQERWADFLEGMDRQRDVALNRS